MKYPLAKLWVNLFCSLLINQANAESASSVDAFATSLPVSLQNKLSSLKIPLPSVSLLVSHIEDHRPILAINSHDAKNPASVMKMITTFAALSKLGPGFQWETEIRRTGLVRNGTLEGDLILIGRGDPFYTKQDLWQLVNELNSRGIRSIGGDLIVDREYFELPEFNPGAFDDREYRPYNVGPDAMLFNFNTIDFVIVPLKHEKRADVRVVPEVQNLQVISRIKKTSAKCTSANISLNMNVDQSDGIKAVTFSGRYPESCGRYTLTRAVTESQELLYGTMATIFGEKGGALHGGLLLGQAPDDSSKLLTQYSETLSEVIRSTNKFSNNVMSRQLLLTLGAHCFGEPANLEKGKKAVIEILNDHDIDTSSLILDNGSGLCRECRVSAEMLSQLVTAAWHSRYMPEFFASLGVTGVDGSLKKRFKSNRTKGLVHMKTGTIDHVSAMAGMVHANSGERYSFALMINHPNVHRGKGLAFQRAVLQWLIQL